MNENVQEVATPAYPEVAPVFEFDWNPRLLHLRRVYAEAEECGREHAIAKWQETHDESAALHEYYCAFADVVRYQAEEMSLLYIFQRPAGAPPLLLDVNFEDMDEDNDGYKLGWLNE